MFGRTHIPACELCRGQRGPALTTVRAASAEGIKNGVNLSAGEGWKWELGPGEDHGTEGSHFDGWSHKISLTKDFHSS